MRDQVDAGADFAAYVAARWSVVVRSLVLLGCPRERAEDVAVRALARCHDGWRALQDAGDLDVATYRAVVDTWRREHAEPEEAPGPDGSTEESTEESTDEDEALLRAVEAELAGLPPERREARVLRFVAGLADDQVADVLETPVGVVAGARPEDDYHRAAARIEVSPVSVPRVLAEAQARRTRRRRRVLAGVAAALVVAGVVVWTATRPEPRPPSSRPEVTTSPNPADVAWYAAGLLHLRDVTVELPALADLVEVGTDAVYADGAGRVALVTAEGRRTFIGRADPGSGLAGSDADGWAAWVDVGQGRPVVEVYDVARRRPLGSWDVEAGSDVVAIDQARVFYATPDGAVSWSPPDAEPERLGVAGLADVDSATRVYQRGPTRIEMVQPFFNVSFTRPGVDAQVGPGGIYVLASLPGRPAGNGRPGRPVLYDTRSGDRLPTGLAPDELVLDAAFGPNHTVSYLVVDQRDLTGSGDLEGRVDPLVVLRTCDVSSAQCYDVVPIAHAGAEPLLAR